MEPINPNVNDIVAYLTAKIGHLELQNAELQSIVKQYDQKFAQLNKLAVKPQGEEKE